MNVAEAGAKERGMVVEMEVDRGIKLGLDAMTALL